MSQIETLDNYYRFDMATPGKASCYVNWPELVQNQKAVNAALRAYRVNGFSLDARRAVLERIEQVRARLACKLRKPECQP